MNKKRILLLNPPFSRKILRDNYCCFTSQAGYLWPPTDLIVLSGLLHRAGMVEVIDSIAEGLNNETCLTRIGTEKYDAVIFLTGTVTWRDDIDFMRRVHTEKAPAHIIATGNIAIERAEECLREHPFLSAIILDYTDASIERFINDETNALTGLVIRQGDALMRYNRSEKKSFAYGTPPHDIFPLKHYNLPTIQQKPFTTILASYGCAYACRFCIQSQVPYKKRLINDIEQELQYLDEHNIRELFFDDPTFTIDEHHARSVCYLFHVHKHVFSWSCNIHVATVSETLLKVMYQAGCHTVFMGIESGVDEILERHHKGVKTEDVQRVVALCNKVGLRVGGYFIIGLLGDTHETIKKTIDFACSLNLDYASFSIAAPASGTSLRDEAVRNEWCAEHDLRHDPTAYPRITISGLSKDQLWQLRKQAYRRFYLRPQQLWKQLKHIRSIAQLCTLVRTGCVLLLQRRDCPT